MENFIKQLADLLVQKNWMLVTAESCTGGSIAAACTSMAGSSKWFDRGFVTYSNESKVEMLDVAQKILDQHGAVSEQCARAMVEGAVKNSHGQVALATTGIAGPSGGSPEKTVGLVWFAWLLPTQPIVSESKQFAGDRQQVQSQAVNYSINQLVTLLTKQN